MNKCDRFAFAVVTAVAVSALAGTASAEVGKKISVSYISSGLIAAAPAFTDGATVGVPTTYRSRSNVLKVTTAYQAGCAGGDSIRSKIDVGGVDMLDAGLPVEAIDEDASHQIVAKTYYLVPESMGGPAIPPAPMVTLKLTSQLGVGCTVAGGTIVVEALK